MCEEYNERRISLQWKENLIGGRVCSKNYFGHQNTSKRRVMSFPEKNKLNFKKRPHNLQIETFRELPENCLHL